MKKLLISAALVCITSLSAVATEAVQITTEYDVKRGFAETLSVSQTDQLGKFRVVLNPVEGSADNSRLILAGVLKGVLNPDFTLNHTMVNKDRTGVLYTAGDSITMVYGGDPTCEGGTGTTPFEVEETLYIVAGTGEYSGIQPGSYIVVKGTVNNCPSLPEYGRNDFEVIGGSVIFTQEVYL